MAVLIDTVKRRWWVTERYVWPWLLVVSIAAVALRFTHIVYYPLWFDEAWSAWVAALPFDRMINAVAGDVHPPLYFVILWGLVHVLGDSMFVVRLPSALFSLASLALSLRIVERLQISGAFIGFTLMALVPFQLFFADEARGYALLEMLYLGACLAALSRRWAWLAVCNAALLYTHNYGAIYAALAGLLAFLVVDRREWWKVVAWNAGAIVVYAPWVAFGLAGQVAAFGEGHWIRPTSPGGFMYPIYMFVWNVAMPRELQSSAMLLVAVLVFIALVKVVRDRHVGARVLAYLFLGPLVLAALASWAWKPIYLWRALIGAAPAMYYLIGWALTHRVSRLGLIMAHFLFTPMLFVALINHPARTFEIKGAMEMAQVAEHVAANWQAGDVIYHINIGSVVELHRALGDRTNVMLPTPDHTIVGYSLQTRRALSIVEEPIGALTWRRAWLIWVSSPGTYEREVVARDAILAGYRNEKVLGWGDGELIDGGVWLLWR
ncbi:MAG TPA: glycosyltransferase family 39 protein [Anaerolineae bacterium]